MRLLALFLYFLLFPILSLGSDFSDQKIKFYSLDKSNSATLTVESIDDKQSLKVLVKVDEECYEDAVQLVQIQSKSLNKDFDYIKNCYGDFYEIEPANKTDTDLIVKYMKSHSTVNVGFFEFDIADFGNWNKGDYENLEKSKLSTDVVLPNEENLDSEYSKGWLDAEKQMRRASYTESLEDSSKKGFDNIPSLDAKTEQPHISSESMLLLFSIFCLSINLYQFMTSRINEGWHEKYKEANLEIESASENNSKLETELLALKNKITSLTVTVQDLSKENAKLKFDLKNDVNNYLNKKPYIILGVASSDFEFSQVKSNYKKLSQIYHPDKSGSHEMMQALNNAYDKLKAKTVFGT